MKNLKKNVFVITSVLIMMISVSVAAKKIEQEKVDKEDENIRFPMGCYDEGYSIKHKVLNLYADNADNTDSMYFIHNMSDHPIKFYQMRTGNEPFVMYNNGQILAKSWGVVATDEKDTKFICARGDDKTQYGDIIDCKDVLDICKYTHVKFGNNIHGNYWMVEGTTMRNAQGDVTRQGALIRP